MTMKATRFGILALLVALAGASQASSTQKKGPAPGSDRERLIGAWHLAAIAGPDGTPVTTGVPIGMLIYARDGHMSVQLMYPKPSNTLSNEYVQDGYEASFGSYDVNDAAHTVAHHVQGSITRDLLVGKDLPRVYQFGANGQLIIKPARRTLVG
jgi:hypothetical protein